MVDRAASLLNAQAVNLDVAEVCIHPVPSYING